MGDEASKRTAGFLRLLLHFDLKKRRVTVSRKDRGGLDFGNAVASRHGLLRNSRHRKLGHIIGNFCITLRQVEKVAKRYTRAALTFLGF